MKLSLPQVPSDWFNKELNGQQLGGRDRWDFWEKKEEEESRCVDFGNESEEVEWTYGTEQR